MSLIVAILAVAALVWGTVALRFGGLLCGCLAVVPLGSCLGAPFFSCEHTSIPLTSDRILLLIVAITFVALRRTSMTDLKPVGWADGILFELIAALALRNGARIRPALT
jgi:hypothetical protein